MTGRSAFHIRRSTLNVRCLPAFGGARGDQGSMFKLLHLKLRLNLHITLKLRIQVRSSEIIWSLLVIKALSFSILQKPNHLKNLLQLFHVPTRHQIVFLCDFFDQPFKPLFPVVQFPGFRPDAFPERCYLADP